MNIHIDKEEFDFLMNNLTTETHIMGSHLYGTNTEESDKDYLVIFDPVFDLTLNPFSNHHQFQYKDVENNIDYNFVDIITFIKNLINGDSVVNYEVICSKEFDDSSKYRFLSSYIDSFKTYTLIKAYLGLAKRDLRHLSKKTGRDKIKCIGHILRGIASAASIYNSAYKEFDYIKATSEVENDVNLQNEFLQSLNYVHDTLKQARDSINKDLEENLIARVLDVKIQSQIWSELRSIVDLKKVDSIPTSLLNKVYTATEQIEMKYE